MCGNGMTEGRNKGTTEGQGESSIIAPTFSKRGYKQTIWVSDINWPVVTEAG